MKPTAHLQFLQGNMIIYLLKFNWFENTMQIFLPTSKSFQKLPRMIWGRGEEGTSKVDTHVHVKGDGNENILRIIINNYSMNVLPGSTNSIGWQLSFVVKNAENNVYGNNAATLYNNRANMIPPLRIPEAVCRQIYPLGQKKRPAAPKSLEKNDQQNH